ncbi:MAG: hypothetical protein RIS70_2463 [Planctomycetota bacterium]|jgi:hypothetical protein
MELEFELHDDDLNGYRRLMRPRWKRRAIAILRLSVATVPAVVLSWAVEAPWSLVACVVVVLLMIVSAATNRVAVNSKPMKVRVNLLPQGIESQVDGVWHRYAWSQIGDVRESTGLVLVPLGFAHHLIVPERSFPSARVREDFLRSIDQFRQRVDAALPALDLGTRWDQPAAMQLEYRNRLEDYLRMQHPGLTGGTDVGCLLWLVLVCCLGLTGILAREPVLVNFGASVLGLIALFLLMHAMQGPLARWYVRRRANREEFERSRVLSVGPSGFSLDDGRTQVVADWGATGSPQWLGRHVLLTWSNRAYIDLIPMTSIGTVRELERFIQAIQQWRRDWHEQHPGDAKMQPDTGNPYQPPNGGTALQDSL